MKMSASARIIALLLMISAATAGPAGEIRKDLAKDERDLTAESSEIIQEAVAAPSDFKITAQKPSDLVAEADSPEHSIELLGGHQTFFPSFANLFEPRNNNNFRVGFGNQEGAFSQRPNSYRSLLNYPLFSGYRSFEGFGKSDSQVSAPLVDAGNKAVLGSGNFGIIRGGTFNAQNDELDYEDTAFYNNGHGGPSFGVGYIANPRPNFNQDQFANFKDFADINTPSNSAYSHFVVVYANKNATMDEISEETKKVVTRPKNIIETLESLDEKNEKQSSPKLSKFKAKLEATKLSKKQQWKKANVKYSSQKHDIEEPLLALS